MNTLRSLVLIHTPRIIAAAIVACAGLVVATPCSAQINVSTGIATWDYNTVSQWGSNGGIGVASVVNLGDADYFGGWVGNDSDSSWIAANPGNTAYNNGTYTVSFDLSDYDLSTVALSGSWTIDDAGSLYLNGDLLSTLGDGSWGSLTAFTAPNSDFVSGTNMLTIIGGPTDNYLEGVRLEGEVTGTQIAQSAPDEASTIALLGVALAGIAGLRRRKILAS